MTRSISYHTYCEKIWGGWMGKSIGGTVGAPIENQKALHRFTRETLWPDTIYPNDDLDIQVVWLEALQERGVWLTHQDLADYWQDRCWYNFCEYGFFLHNVQRGIHPPVSGWWNNRFFRESEGCPIRSEIWGMIAPGNPALAAAYARQDGELDHCGVSVQSEMFLAAAAAEAFVESDLHRVLQAGLAVLPADSPLQEMVATVREVCARYPDPAQAWRLLIRRYGNRDASKAITNQAIVVMALLLGGGDFSRTMLIACNSGWDADCTAATAGALLGILQGPAGLPQDWVAKMGPTLACGINVRHKTAPFDEVVADTAQVGLEVAGLRNDAITITGAPTVPLRPQPAPRVTLQAAYPEAPVLWRERVTPVDLQVQNPHPTPVTGRLTLTTPAHVACHPTEATLTLAPGETRTLRLEARHQGPVMWDKNLLTARWEDAEETVTHAFGLGGARQWTVYGPYWDMWDTTKNAICPYNNPERVICPNMTAEYGGDAWNQYVRLDHPYLNEARLLNEELPEELPAIVERGQDYLDGAHLAGFHGQAVFYLVRTLVADAPTEAVLKLGSDVPLAVWHDGRELFRREAPRAWTPQDIALPITLGPEPTRLVVKLARQGDALTFSLFPGKRDLYGDGTRGHSMVLDTVGDVVSALPSAE